MNTPRNPPPNPPRKTPGHEYPRWPAALVLVLTAAAGWAYLQTAGAKAPADGGPTLEQLELMIANPDAPAETWRRYAQRLEAVGRPAHAASAYQRYLDADPYDRETRLRCALALADAADDAGPPDPAGQDKLLAFMQDMVLMDPKLAVDVFDRPELKLFLGDPRFQEVKTAAVIQSMD